MFAFCTVIILAIHLSVSYAKVCPDAWVRHGNSCYHFSRDHLSIPEAMVMCNAFGSKLLEINSWYEYRWIVSKAKQFKGYYFVGASDHIKEGHWVWINSGKSIPHSYWKPAQPDNWKTVEHCAQLKSDLIDLPCSTRRLYICEK